MLAVVRLISHVLELGLGSRLRLGRFVSSRSPSTRGSGRCAMSSRPPSAMSLFALVLVYARGADPRRRRPLFPRRQAALRRRALAGHRHLRRQGQLHRHLRSAPRQPARRQLHRRRHRARRLHGQSRPQVDPRARGARPLLAVPRLPRGPLHRRPAQSLRHRPARRAEDPLFDGRALDRAEAPEPRRRRLDAADAVRPRHLQDAAERSRGRPRPSCGARSRNGGWRRSSITS